MASETRGPGPPRQRKRGLAPSLRTIGPYEVIDLLGQGGMAAVYLARDTRSGNQVAVKVLARMRPSWVHRFSREFEAARKVDHPNVVRVLEAGEADGVAFYSMERIEGVTASRYVRGLGAKEPLPPPPPMDFRGPTELVDPEILDRTLAVAIQLARAVGAIHEVGIVHRDLKPGNVLVTEGGIVKLVDFGVVKWLEELNSFTQVGHVVGSYSYMSPEQITGTQVDHRADMYGMGVLLYELITGAPPFRARRPQEYLWLHCTSQPDPVSRRLDGVPAQFDALLLRLLSKEPADRPETMASVENELLGILSEQRAAEPDFEIQIEDEDDADTEPEHPTEDDQDDRTQGSAAAPPSRVASPSEATRPIDAAEIAELRKLKRASPPPADGEDSIKVEFDPPDLEDDSPTAPVLAGEATERHAVPFKDAGRGGAAALAALVTPKHVGRKDEIDALMTSLKRVRKGGVRGVLVEGEEGLGKSRLLHTFRGLAWVKGARVAIGRCDENGDSYCSPFQEILVRLAGPGLARSHQERIIGPDRELLHRFFPSLEGTTNEAPDSTLSLTAIDLDQSALFRAVADTLRRASEDGPLVLGIENLHCVDRATAQLIGALLRRLASPNPAPVLLVFTYRSEDMKEGDSPASTLLASLEALPHVQTIALSPLEPHEMRELIRSVCVDVPVSSEVIDRLARASRGNPRFAVEIARTLVEAGGAPDDSADWDLPTTLLAAYERRLAGLPKPARDVARCIAVIGGAPPLNIVHTASGLNPGAFEAAISELERRRVADVDRRAEDDRASLHSGALRTAVLNSLSSNQARSLHRRAAAAWLKWAGRDPNISGHVARHFYAAGEDRVAIPHALRAASTASESLDRSGLHRWMALIGDLAEVLPEMPSEMVYSYFMLRWMVAFDDGKVDQAASALTQAAEYAPDARARLDTGLACARLHTRNGKYASSVKVCRRGLREARSEDCHDLGIRFALHGARAARRSGDLESALAWLAEADLSLSLTEALPELAVRIGWTRSAVLLDLGRRDEAEAEIHRAIDLAIRSGEESAEAGLRTNLAVLFWQRGALEDAAREMELADRMFNALGAMNQGALAQANLSELRFRQGRLDEAFALAQGAWDTFRRFSDRAGILTSGLSLILCSTARGDTKTAAQVFEVVESVVEDRQPIGETWTAFMMGQARWHQSLGELAIAWNYMGRATRSLGPGATARRKQQAALLRAQLMWDREQITEARPLLEQLVVSARTDGHVLLLCEAEAMLSAVLCRLGEDHSPQVTESDLLKHNVTLAIAVAYYNWQAYRSLGDNDAAERERSSALAIARRFGFTRWAERLDEPPS